MNTAAPYVGIGVVVAFVGLFVGFRAVLTSHLARPAESMAEAVYRLRRVGVVALAVTAVAGTAVLVTSDSNPLAPTFLVATVIGMCVVGFDVALLMILALEKAKAERDSARQEQP